MSITLRFKAKTVLILLLAQAQLDKQAADALELFDTYEETEVDDNVHNTFCKNCQWDCHAPCGLDFLGKDACDHLTGCSCMSNNSCTVCPRKCPYHYHRHQKKVKLRLLKSRKNPGYAVNKVAHHRTPVPGNKR